MKGVGGFHLLCDATSAQAVLKLRERKRRDRKPLAVLFLDVQQVSGHAEVDDAAREALLRCRLADRVAQTRARLDAGR